MRVIVVGGGPVGLFAATVAAQRGMAVTLFEPKAGDGDKACGEGLMPPAVAALRGIGVAPSGRSFRGIRYLDAAGCRQVRADVPNGPGLGVRRTELVRALRQAADHAGVRREQVKVSGVRTSNDGATVTTVGGDLSTADVVLGCDGLNSTVRRCLRLERPVNGHARYGLVAHFSVAPWSKDVEVYWGSGGEAYVTPVSDDVVGVAMLGGRGGSFDERLTAMPGLRDRLSGALAIGQVRGAGPLRRSSTSPARGRVMLVGDAAGYVDALTGEGLAVGFSTALAAVEAAAVGRIGAYPRAWHRLTRRSRWSTNSLVRATQVDAARRTMLPIATASPRAFERMVGWFG